MTLIAPSGLSARPKWGRFQSFALQPYQLDRSDVPLVASAGAGGAWESHLCFEGLETGDGREIAPGALKLRPGPSLPLMGLDQRTFGHMLARACGSMVEFERRDGGEFGTIYGAGTWGATELGQHFEQLATPDENGNSILHTVSVDLEVRNMEWVIKGYDDDGYEEYLMRITDASIMGACYSSDTEVLTDHGWKRFDQINRGVDRVATRNPKTGAFEWQEPTAYTDQDWDSALHGKMVAFSNRGLDLFVTPNHRMLIQTQGGLEAFVPAEKLMALPRGNYGVPLVSEWHDNDVATFRIEGPEPVAEGLCACGCGAETRTRTRWEGGGRPPGQLRALPGHGHGKSTKPLVLAGDDFATFMGAWLAEGCVDVKRGRVMVTQAVDGRGFEMYQAVISSMVGKDAYHDGHSFTFKNRRLADYLAQFGHAPDKFIPAEVKEMSRRQLRLFWDAYMAGDGTADGRRAYTTSKRLADDLQEVGQKLGLWVTIAQRAERTTDCVMADGRRIKPENCLPSYILGIHNRNQGQGKGTGSVASWHWRTTEHDYVGKVHCVTVPNESLYVRRNGKPAWCGNTVVPFPAFSRAFIAPKGGRLAMMAEGATESSYEIPGTSISQNGPIVIAASAAKPTEHPPAEWFPDASKGESPGFTGVRHVRVGPMVNGWRPFSGHLADWTVPHISLDGQVYAPHSTSGYRYFQTKPFTVMGEDGPREIKVGVIAVGGGHAPKYKPDGTHFGWRLAGEFYDDPRFQGAIVVMGEDNYGPWISGAVAPGATELQVKMLGRSDVSGDWRGIGGVRELIGICSVNFGAFPVVEQEAIVAAGYDMRPVDFTATYSTSAANPEGELEALIAAGMIRQNPEEMEIRDVKRRIVALERALEPFRGLGMEWLAKQMTAEALEAKIGSMLARTAGTGAR